MRHIALALTGTALLAACNTVPEPEAPPVTVEIPPLETCTPISALTRVVIPEKTETYYAITEIENPPYEPIQRTEEQTRVIEPERVIFVDSDGREVTDICDTEINPSGMTSG